MADRRMKIVVVGGVAGGATCATRCRRLNESAEILMLERGRHLSFANCGLPYHIGGVIPDRGKLTGRPADSFSKRYNIEARAQSEVTGIDPAARTVTILNRATGESYTESYDKLVLSPGAEPIRPKLDGIDDPRVLTLRNVKDMDALVSAACKGRSAVVIGAGFIGLEMVENLHARGLQVTLVEKLNQVFPPLDSEMAAPIAAHILSKGAKVLLGDGVAGFADSDGQLAVRLESGRTVTADFAVLAIGVRPETSLAKTAGLALGDTGGIRVNEHMQTSDPNIYAVGDAVEVKHTVTGRGVLIPLAGPAHKQARAAANHMMGQPDDTYASTQGTSIVGIFDLTVAVTGANERALRDAGMSYQKIYIHASDHAGYYPGASQLHIKLLFDPASGKVLGGQIYGQDGVDKRIDVLAVAVRHKLTVHDLVNLELAYAPQYGSAKDPINIAGSVASNVIRGVSEASHFQDLDAEDFLLDVRTPEEVAAGAVPGATNIGVDDLRGRLAELPDDRAIHVYCGVGMRAYLAERILRQNGFQAANLSGGYASWQALHAMDEREEGDNGGGSPPSGPGGGRTVVATDSPAPQAAQPDEGPVQVQTLDARGMQCPAPLIQLARRVADMEAGSRLRILSSDTAFAADIRGWSHRTGHELLSVQNVNGHVEAVIRKGEQRQPASQQQAADAAQTAGYTSVVFSGSMDRALAAMVLANGAAASGMPSTLFFTFWGLSILRKPRPARGQKRSLLDRMFAWMLPAGVRKLKLSQWQFGGFGRWLMNRRMKAQNVMSLGEMLESARQAGVRLVACKMSMDMLGLRAEDLIDGVEFAGVGDFMDTAAAARVNTFI